MKHPIVVLSAALLSGGASVCGQIPISAGTYSQNFDSLAASGTSNPWTDNVTLPGWYAAKTAGGTNVTTYRADNGGNTAGAIYSFGATSSPERALGSIASGTPGIQAFGVRFANDTSGTITQLTITCTGEQWRNGGSLNVNTLTFAYRIGSNLTNADAGNTAAWTSLASLNFPSPTVSTNATALDGNVSTNRQPFAGVALSGLTIPPGEEIFLRWRDVDDSGFDHGLAVDDLTVVFSGGTNPPPPAVTAFSLVTYNVAGNGANDWSTNAPQVRAIARQLQYLNPDFITLQEIPFDLRYEMTNFVTAFFPGYALAVTNGGDSFITSALLSRYPITRFSKWLDGIDLRSFGYSNADNNLDNFTRDLSEIQVNVPGFPQPLHLLTAHLKSTSGTTYTDAAAKRAAEAAAITNFIATNLHAIYPLHPYVLTGDMNDSSTNALAIQTLISPPTGLRLTNPTNPFTGSVNTFSIRTSVSSRLDYIFPNALLGTNIASAQVFRTDLLPAPPPPLLGTDSETASDHLPVLVVFNNPYAKPFKLLSVARNNQTVTLKWESVLGQPYRVESSTNLTAWTGLANNFVATNSTSTYVTNLGDAVRFFRVSRAP